MILRLTLLPIFWILIFSSVIFSQVDTDLGSLFREQKYETLIREGKKKLKNEGKNPQVSMVVGRSLFQTGKIEEAIPYLEAAIETPNMETYIDAWALDYLGKIHFMKGEYEKSKSALIEARSLNATKNASYDTQNTLLLFGFENVYKSWQTFETDHIIFHIQDTKMLGDVAEYISERTKAYENIQNFFGSDLPKKVDFFIWKSQLEGYRYLRTSLGFSKPEACLLHCYTFQTPGYELAHVISNYAITEFVQKNKFITEGMGVCFDGLKRNRTAFAKKALKKNNLEKISIEKIWKDPEVVNEAILFAVGGAFIELIIEEGGKQNFLDLLPNQTFENAQKIYGNDLEKWMRDFEKKVNRK